MAETKKKSTTRSKSKKAEEKQKIRQMSLEKAQELRKKAELRDEILSLVVMALGVFLFLSLKTDVVGIVGGALKKLFLGLFGKAAFILPFYLFAYGLFVLLKKTSFITVRSVICCIVSFFLIAVIYTGITHAPLEAVKLKTLNQVYSQGADGGGSVSMMLMSWITALVGKACMFIFSAVGIVIMLLFIFDTPLSQIFDNFRIQRRAKKEAKEQRKLMRQVAEEIEAANRPAKEMGVTEAQRQPKTKNRDLSYTNSLSEFNQKEREAEPPKLNTAPLREFEKPSEGSPASSPSPIKYTEPFDTEGPKPAKEEPVRHVFDDSFSANQKQILGYVADDEHFGILRGDMSDSASSIEEKPAPKRTKNEEKKAEEEAIRKEQESIQKMVAEEGTEKKPDYIFPPIDLLKKPVTSKGSQAADLSSLSKILEDTLASFGVSATVIDAIKGPAVTRFEVKPASGVKVSKITSLHDDIAMNLSAKSLRIEAPIPGKSAVGIEISNDDIKTVFLREIIDSKEFKNHKSKIGVGLGKTISGENVVADLKKMPHLLVAGATGSGKSVCINSIIMSILYKAKPDEVKLILIDPKVVELSNYNGIPHLLIPVVTEPAKASAALGWAVSEMEDRYHKFAEVNVRDLEGYNDYMRAEEEYDKIIPQMVIIIDELYDLMMAASNSVESSIGRLAAKARAAGIYLIVATQRPSVDVITGVIKANIPSRIAFMVSSQVDSRTILDGPGAEHLLGKGDMLFFPTGISKPIRVQGCFVSDEEVNNVIDFVKSHKMEDQTESQQQILTAMNKNCQASSGQDEEEDDLLNEVIEFVVTQEECSVSKLQRRFRIGYNRSARLIELLETMGIVGPSEGSKGRKVLMSSVEYEAMKAGNEEVPAAEEEQ